MENEKWKGLNKREVEPIEIEAMQIVEEFDPADPAQIAFTFLAALDDVARNCESLELIVTPESLGSWGDFIEASEYLASIPNWGLGSMPTPAEGDSSVQYAKILSGVDQTFQVLEEQAIFAAALITLVWRSDYGRWMVHALGEAVHPDAVPHGSS